MRANDFIVERILSGQPGHLPLTDYERLRARLPGTEAINQHEVLYSSGESRTWVTVRLAETENVAHTH